MSNPKQLFNIFSSAGKSGRILPGRCVFVLLLLSCLIIACDKINIFSRPYVAKVNGSKIYLDDYQARLDKKMQMLPEDFLNQPDLMKKFEEEVLDSMITEKIMDLRARNLTYPLAILNWRIKLRK